MMNLMFHICICLGSSYCIWKDKFYFPNYNEHLMFFLYYEEYASHSVKLYLLFMYLSSLEVSSRSMPAYMPVLWSRHFSKVTAVALFFYEIPKGTSLRNTFFPFLIYSVYSVCLSTIWLMIRIFCLGVDKWHHLCYWKIFFGDAVRIFSCLSE